MEININFPGGLRVDAHFNGFCVQTDQAQAAGGGGEYPDPFSYFLSGLATCAGVYVLKFCQMRNIPTENIGLRLSNGWNKELGVAENIDIRLELPPEFPEKYYQAVARAINECSVKKTILHCPQMTVTTVAKTAEAHD